MNNDDELISVNDGSNNELAPVSDESNDDKFRLQQGGESGLVFASSESTGSYELSDPSSYEESSSEDAQKGSVTDGPRIEAPDSDDDVYGLADPLPQPSEIAEFTRQASSKKKTTSTDDRKKKTSFMEKFFGKSSGERLDSTQEEEDISLETLRERRERAMMEEETQDRPKIERTPLPARPFWDDILKPFAKPNCVARLLMVAGAAVIPLLCATLFFSKILSVDVAKQMELNDVQTLTAFFRCLWHDRVIFLLFCFLWGVFSVPVSFQVFIDTANGADEISDWPEYSFIGGLMDFLWLASLIMIAGIPGAALFSFFGFNHIVGLTLSATLLTPIFYLSCMQADARFTLLTKETIASLKRNAKSWLIFTGISFAFLFGTMAISLAAIRFSIATREGASISLSNAFIVAIVLSFVFSFIPALYLRFLGRLAWIIEDDARKRAEENERVEEAFYDGEEE